MEGTGNRESKRRTDGYIRLAGGLRLSPQFIGTEPRPLWNEVFGRNTRLRYFYAADDYSLVDGAATKAG